MPPQYNIGDVVRLKGNDPTKYVTITSITPSSNSSTYLYYGKYPVGGLIPHGEQTLLFPERTIEKRMRTANGHYEGNAAAEVEVAMHIALLRRVAAAASGGGGGGAAAASGGGGGGVTPALVPVIFEGDIVRLRPETTIQGDVKITEVEMTTTGLVYMGQIVATGQYIGPFTPRHIAFVVGIGNNTNNNNNNNNAAAEAAIMEQSLQAASGGAPAPVQQPVSEDPEALNNSDINKNEDPKPLSKGGRRRTKAKKRKFKRSMRRRK